MKQIKLMNQTDDRYPNQVQLNYVITPIDASEHNVLWDIEDKTIATIDNNGLVTGIKTGTTIAKVTTVDGGFTDTCEVNVSVIPNLTLVFNSGYSPENISKINHNFIVKLSDGQTLLPGLTWGLETLNQADLPITTESNGIVTIKNSIVTISYNKNTPEQVSYTGLTTTGGKANLLAYFDERVLRYPINMNPYALTGLTLSNTIENTPFQGGTYLVCKENVQTVSQVSFDNMLDPKYANLQFEITSQYQGQTIPESFNIESGVNNTFFVTGTIKNIRSFVQVSIKGDTQVFNNKIKKTFVLSCIEADITKLINTLTMSSPIADQVCNIGDIIDVVIVPNPSTAIYTIDKYDSNPYFTYDKTTNKLTIIDASEEYDTNVFFNIYTVEFNNQGIPAFAQQNILIKKKVV